MADRFPLIVNASSRKIEEMVSGDNLDLTGNGIAINGNVGISGQYLKSTGTGLVWDSPGNVYLTTVQTLTNKTIESSFLSGTTNTFINIPNSALVNSSITVNGTAIALGGSVVTPDNNTTYSISALDGAAGKKIVRLTSGGNFGSGVDDDVTFVAGTNVTLARVGDEITINSSYVDTNTVTRLAGSGGVFQSGDVTIAASGSVSVSQVGNTITLTGVDTNTITRLRGTASGTYESGDISILASGATTVSQSGTDITISSVDTITRVRGTGGSFQSGDITIAASGSSTVAQVGNTITIDSSYVDTITRVRGTTSGVYESGDITFVASGATTVTQNGKTITISSVNTDTGASFTASKGTVLNALNFELKNADNLTNSRILKWDTSNTQLVSGIIEDDGSLITINGDLKVTGTTTTVESQTLVIADAQIELRRGLNLTGTDGGIQVNRTTNALGLVQTYSALQWFESGGYWRTYDGSVSQRLVTEGEIQTLTNKTLSSPTLTNPTLGIATATSINGLTISQTVAGTLTIASNKTFTVNNTLTFTGTDTASVAFGSGGTVAYTSNNLSVFANTTSAQLRGILTDETGTGVAVFGTNPRFTTSITTQSTSFDVFNTGATTVNAFGAGTNITIGATTGTTTIRNALAVDGNTTLGNAAGDTITITGILNSENNDIIIRGSSIAPIAIGRGGNAIVSNTRVGFNALNSNTTGSQNAAFGYEAALSLNSGASNTAFGYQALRAANTGIANVAVGRGSALNLLDGDKNVSVGTSSLTENQIGNSNVCIGHYAGYNCLGSGNVLIGPADDENSTNSTYQPPSISGDRQLIIGSGTGTWLRGDANFDVTAPQNFNVGNNLVVSGNLTVNGTTTTINSSVISVDDKSLELGSVIAGTFSANVVSGSSTISGVSPMVGLIPGVAVASTTAGISVPVGTVIVSIIGTTAFLSNIVTGTGSATFTTDGATDLTANGGGVILKGTTDKSITWSDTTDAWTSTEHFDLATGKAYRIGNVQIANGNTTTIGPATGSWSLGAGVTASSLTSVGTLTSLNTSGTITSSFPTVGSAALTLTNDAATNLANSTFSIAKTVKGGIHFGNAAGTGGAARQVAITFRGNSTDEAQAGIYVINNNTIGTAMTLATTDNYTTGPQQGLTISHTGDITVNRGNLVIGTSGKGIDFSANANASGMTSELLADYEEGTFSPTAFGNSTAGTTTYGLQYGMYVKIGNLCHFQVRMQVTNMTGTGDLILGGLPFTAFNDSERAYGSVAVGYLDNLSFGNVADTHLALYTSTNSTNVIVRSSGNNRTSTAVPVDTGFTILYSGTYRTA
jgi:hypothetical protein